MTCAVSETEAERHRARWCGTSGTPVDAKPERGSDHQHRSRQGNRPPPSGTALRMLGHGRVGIVRSSGRGFRRKDMALRRSGEWHGRRASPGGRRIWRVIAATAAPSTRRRSDARPTIGLVDELSIAALRLSDLDEVVATLVCRPASMSSLPAATRGTSLSDGRSRHRNGIGEAPFCAGVKAQQVSNSDRGRARDVSGAACRPVAVVANLAERFANSGLSVRPFKQNMSGVPLRSRTARSAGRRRCRRAPPACRPRCT